jgi:hypothetical protein
MHACVYVRVCVCVGERYMHVCVCVGERCVYVSA